MKILIHKFGWYTESTKHFDTKMPKIGVPTKGGASHDEYCGVDGCHDDQGAYAVGPWSYMQT